MHGAASAKHLLKQYIQQKLKEFHLNSSSIITLPVISSLPGVGASHRQDIYRKVISHPQQNHHVKFITKNNKPYTFVWQTNPQQLKTAVRWGIMKPHSITGKVISALGQYRVAAHKRMIKGMYSNGQQLKLKLLDLYQDRFEALEDLELLINSGQGINEYNSKLDDYISRLTRLRYNIDARFSQDVDKSGFTFRYVARIINDLQADIDRAKAYRHKLNDQDNVRPFNRARGTRSINEFIKQQMLHGLYELQGINQDLTFSRQRHFAMTRGIFNDFIEDARKEIDDQQADLRNAVTKKHQGTFSNNDYQTLSYDFSEHGLTPDKERDALMAISFIEGWDKIEQKNNNQLTVSNPSGQEPLDRITATRWRNHRNAKAFFKHLGHYLLNLVKSVFVATKPWAEETWSNKEFHLETTKLHQYTNANQPMWKKPISLFKLIAFAIKDAFHGVRDVSSKLAIRMPKDIVNDWLATNELPAIKDTLGNANDLLSKINKVEKERLDSILARVAYLPGGVPTQASSHSNYFATVEYPLVVTEQNDILTSLARGINEFITIFSHNIYAKDPIAGIAFTAAYAAGAGAIYLPSLTSTLLGKGYVTWFSNLAYTMGSSKLTATIAAGSTQAQLAATAIDGISNGPSGMLAETLYQLGEDPVTVGAYFFVAYSLGYLLANGAFGHPIPWVSEFIKEDMGTVPSTTYPLIGAKFGILVYESFMAHDAKQYSSEALADLIKQLPEDIQVQSKAIALDIQRAYFAKWLAQHAAQIQKLPRHLEFDITRHIDQLYTKEQSASLKKLINPETEGSIAFQLISIPLTYIPAVIRFVISLVLSVYALGMDKPNPFAPTKRAAGALFDKVKKDLSRLITFATYLTGLLYIGVATPAKTITNTVILIVGRIAGLFNVKPAYKMHQAMASVHGFFRKIGELIYPARAIKDVTVAHPNHTLNQIGHSYNKLMTQILSSDVVVAAQDAQDQVDASAYQPLWQLSKKDDVSLAGDGLQYQASNS